MARSGGRVGRVLVRGPLAPFADAYSERLMQRRYTPLSAVNLQRQMAQLSRWLEASGLGVEELSEAHVEAFVSYQRVNGRERWLSRPGLKCLLELLRELGVVAAVAPATPSPTDLLMSAFRRYLLSERGLSEGTVRGYADRAGRFVAGLGPGGLGQLTPAQVTAAVLRHSAVVSVSTTQNFIAGLWPCQLEVAPL